MATRQNSTSRRSLAPRASVTTEEIRKITLPKNIRDVRSRKSRQAILDAITDGKLKAINGKFGLPECPNELFTAEPIGTRIVNLLAGMSRALDKYPERQLLLSPAGSLGESRDAFSVAAEVCRVVASFAASELKMCSGDTERCRDLNELQRLTGTFIPRVELAAQGKRSWKPYKIWAAYDAIAFLLERVVNMDEPDLVVSVPVSMGMPTEWCMGDHKLSALSKSMLGIGEPERAFKEKAKLVCSDKAKNLYKDWAYAFLGIVAAAFILFDCRGITRNAEAAQTLLLTVRSWLLAILALTAVALVPVRIFIRRQLRRTSLSPGTSAT